MDGVMTADDVRSALAAACREAGSAKAWANANGCSSAYVGEVLGGTRDPGPAILRGLGLEKVVSYRTQKPAAAYVEDI